MNYASAKDRESMTKSAVDNLTLLEMPIYSPAAVSLQWPLTIFQTAGFKIS